MEAPKIRYKYSTAEQIMTDLKALAKYTNWQSQQITNLINKYKISASTLLEVIQKTDNKNAESSRRFVVQFIRELQSLK